MHSEEGWAVGEGGGAPGSLAAMQLQVGAAERMEFRQLRHPHLTQATATPALLWRWENLWPQGILDQLRSNCLGFHIGEPEQGSTLIKRLSAE